MHNKVIHWAYWVIQVVWYLTMAMYAILLGIVIYWHFEPSAFDEWHLQQPFQAGAANWSFAKSPQAQGATLNDLGAGMVYWLVGRTTLFFVLLALCLRKALSILVSIKQKAVFYDRNTQAFKQLAFLGLGFAVVSFFNFGTVAGVTTYYFRIPFGALLFSAACWVLSEVFAEGKRLYEDSNSIV